MAVCEVNISDPMTDYFATRSDETILLASSKHTRDLFPEMRKAALNCDIQEVKALADAPKEAEHREKYSMGAGYYLKAEHGYSTGWLIRKKSLDWGMDSIYEVVGKEGCYQKPDNEPDKKESTGHDSKVESPIIGTYKGHAVITLPMDGKGFTFGMSKARAILEHIEEIRSFVESTTKNN